ncbi:YheO-like protein [uncultured Eubacteriales bacterium]|uniref:YheO-like protein n=1 Tax=uncultured Eubacteriales bacterium TaxID=172733 RepID=A0A212KLL0_9FIRM|nr:YheO-like protein [uncultured Eubacteriales bacterium]
MLSQERLSLLKQMAYGMAAHFGPSCEVVIHDLTTDDLEHTVVHIENGQVSGRKEGDGPSHVVLDFLRQGHAPEEDQLAYLTRTPDGKILKSSTLYIKNPEGVVEAIFAINFDVSALLTVENVIKPLISPRAAPQREPERITRSVGDLLDDLIRESVELIGKPVALMDREDKIKAVRFLNDAGAMLITKSGDKIAAYFGISKYTLYSYLDENKY